MASQSTSSPTSPTSTGWTLPVRSPSIILHGRTNSTEEAQALASDGLQRKDSLGGTRNYYGLSSPATLSRPTSSASRRKPVHSLANGSSNPPPLPTLPSRTIPSLPTPRGFLSPKKPASAVRHENLEREAVLRQSQGAIQTSPSDSSSADRATMVTQEDNPLSIQEAMALNHRRSVTETSSPPRTHADLSSDHLVSALPSGNTEKPSDVGWKPKRTLSTAVDEIRPFAQTVGPTVKKRRKYRKYQHNNPSTMFFLGGRIQTGGDSPMSLVLSLVVMFGLFGVWLGTTGVWIWRHGHEYGLVKGGGVAIVIVLVQVCFTAALPPLADESDQISFWRDRELDDGLCSQRSRHTAERSGSGSPLLANIKLLGSAPPRPEEWDRDRDRD
ncbi:hypothetical protein P7C73_g2735, partial [Tremellales sp. Uapishka_1]